MLRAQSGRSMGGVVGGGVVGGGVAGSGYERGEWVVVVARGMGE